MAIWGGPTDLVGGGFDDLEFVGRGGAGTVYRAVEPGLGRTVAVKVLRRGLDSQGEGVPSEARAQAAVSWHANVLSLYGSGTAPDGSPYLVLEYAGGGNLRDRVQRSGPLPYDQWLRVARELSGALAAAHEAEVVHCDVKPSNVLFAEDGSVRLADFGIARAADAATATLDHLEGSLAYAAPELLEGQRPSPANDVYGMALTLWFAATGRQPFGADELPAKAVIARIHSEKLSFNELLPEAPEALRSSLRCAIESEPGKRPSARDLHRTLRSESFGPPAELNRSRRGRPRFRVGAAAALLLVLVSTVLVAAQSRRTPVRQGPIDVCGAYQKSVQQRKQLFTSVSSDLEQSGSPREVVERLLVRYPGEFARTQTPLLAEVARSHGADPTVTESQLSLLALAEVLRSLSGGKAFLFDGRSGAFDPSALPADLREPARAVSEANEVASGSCSDFDHALLPEKARMNSAIISNLADIKFIDGFFSDPKSLDVFDARSVVLMVSVARPLMEELLARHWGWLVEVGERHADLRSAIAIESPDLLLAAAAADPSLLDTLKQERWRQYLKAGYERSGGAARWGMAHLYPAVVQDLRLDQP